MPTLDPDRQVVNEEFNLVVAINLRNLRADHCVTLAQVAKAADMDLTVLSRIESAQRSIKLREATAIAEFLGVDLDRIYKKQRGVVYEWA